MVVCFIEAVVKALEADSYPLYSEWCCCPVTCGQWYQWFVVGVNLKRVSHAVKVYLIGKDTLLDSFGFLL